MFSTATRACGADGSAARTAGLVALGREARREHEIVARRLVTGGIGRAARRRRARRPGSGSRRSRARARRTSGTARASRPRRGTARKAGESFQMSPSGAVADVLERERRDRRRLVARQRRAVGRDDDVAARPAVHAGARAADVVVGAHEEDLDLAAQALARGERDAARASASCARDGRSASRLSERPAEVLRVGELEPLGADALGERDELGHARDVAAVEHHVERQRQPERARRRRDLELGGRGSRAPRSSGRPRRPCPARRAAGCRGRRP